ncbi:MAG: crossover junction endodeoxyribonuclease RuvC [Vampirovibrionales bacterium]|nr:crossover junction endodeoxyribonuclease RuvC [Vampirovibrionales bacterium]
MESRVPERMTAPQGGHERVVLGIDPGLATVGFGIIAASHQVVVARQWGAICTPPQKPIGDRLLEIHTDLSQIITEHRPDLVAIEQIFFCKNAKTLVPVAQARGVILMTLAQFNLPVVEFTPLQVKQTVTGHGGSNKKDVQHYMSQWLKLTRIPKPDDAADALALALCGYRQQVSLQLANTHQSSDKHTPP